MYSSLQMFGFGPGVGIEQVVIIDLCIDLHQQLPDILTLCMYKQIVAADLRRVFAQPLEVTRPEAMTRRSGGFFLIRARSMLSTL